MVPILIFLLIDSGYQLPVAAPLWLPLWATPPNANRICEVAIYKVYQMARVGIILNLISVVLLILWFQFVIPLPL